MLYQLPGIAKKAAYVKKKFSEIAPKYDLFNDIVTLGLHRRWKRFVVYKTNVPPQGTCMDLCCGTADVARHLQEVLPEGKIYGVDFSGKMLKIAQGHKVLPKGNLVLLQGDATQLSFAPESMDAVALCYGLRNVNDLSLCLQEVYRVLKPGGVLVNLDIGQIRVPILSHISRFYFFHIVPRLGKFLYPGQEMFDYLPYSSIDYPKQEALKKIMLTSGFQRVEVYDFLWGFSTVHVAHKQ